MYSQIREYLITKCKRYVKYEDYGVAAKNFRLFMQN